MRTFIFGAGASLHAGYPLAADLWHVMERWVRATFPEDHNFRDAVDTMRTEFDVSKSFELVLMDLDNRIEPLLKASPATRKTIKEKVTLVYLRAAVQSMIPFYFNSVRSQPADLYRMFAADVLAPEDTIITFNYDLAVDRELKRSGKWSIGNGYGFEVDSGSFGNSSSKLFKLHGSTNWRGEPFKGALGFSQGDPADLSLGQRPVIDPSEFEFLGYGSASDPLSHNGRVRIESIIMPTANKRFFRETSLGREWEGFWDSLWYQAGEALRASRKVYVIGYSFPEYDTRARELLAKKICKNIKVEVCCHDGSMAVIDSLKKLTHLRNIQVQPACATTFDGWISSMELK